MRDVIQLLPDTVANQIAAGEVVQRPSSVVKELLENAIDAKADRIHLIVKDAGRTLIQVVDNGVGMSITDARMAFERHATSKIRTTEDIFSISSKGFRGEALASIAAVAQVELKTKTEEDELGTHITIEGGNYISQNPVQNETGSSFLVKNLFYNVPARRKFLKSNNVELKKIQEEFLRVALAHCSISFYFNHNETPVYQLRKNNLLGRIVDVYGKKLQSTLVPISEETDLIKITGYVGKPESAKKSRGEQYFFVNDRFFKSNYFNKAVVDAYEGVIQNTCFPSYFINFEINPEMIDVNIHPTKTEIKFEDESIIYGVLRSVIKRSLGIYNISPSLDFSQDKDIAFFNPNKTRSVPDVSIKVNPTFNPFEQGKKQQFREYKQETKEFYSSFSFEESNEQKNQKLFDEELDFNFYRLKNGYWLWEDEKLYVLDVYRIHQTILYEKFKNNTSSSVLSQKLLFPLEYPLTNLDYEKLESIKKQLYENGFEIRMVSDMAYFDAIPSDLEQDKLYDLIDELMKSLDSHSAEEFFMFFINTYAKVSAKKRNEVTTKQQFEPLFKKFRELELPLYNPFGKKNYAILELNDLELKLN
ncbi:MAG: DNA mismatch repair endonuclease MutL [Flavobacteriales bacterium]|nr:DNA mismatch repair endonuclease MutL [Flavobacteriales bacterium]